MNTSKNVVAIDQVCNKCGNVGFAENIITCSSCKRIFEHMYCMQKRRLAVPKPWHCEECDVKNNIKPKKRQTVLLDDKLAQKFVTPVKRSRPLNRGDSKQSNAPEKQRPGTQNLPPPWRFSSKMPDVRGKGKASGAIRRLGALSVQTNSANINTSPIAPTTPAIPVCPAVKAYETHSQGITRATNTGVEHALSKLPVEAGFRGKDENGHDNKTSGKKACVAFCNQEPLEKTGDPRSHHSPLTGIPVAKSNVSAGIRCQSNVGEKKTVAARTSEEDRHKAPLKKNPVEGCHRSESKCCNEATGLHSKGDHGARISKRSGQGFLSMQTMNIGSSELHNETTKILSAVGFLGNTAQENILLLDSLHPHHPVPNAFWKGDFKIFDTSTVYVFHELQGIQAHMPGIISINVYDNLKRLIGKDIGFKLCRRVDIWPKRFRLDPPDFGDVGVYFFPSKEQRLKDKFKHFVDMMDRQDLALQSRLEIAELLIFTSAQLQDPLVTGIVHAACLWGVFRHIRPKKLATPDKGKWHGYSCTNSGQNPAPRWRSQIREDGVSAAARTRPVPGPDVPPGFSQPVCRKQAQRPVPGPDVPPGFSRLQTDRFTANDNQTSDVPPGFSKPIYPPKRR